jgi:DNA ligase D-like protein (predicted 3'-phosphoesterase)
VADPLLRWVLNLHRATTLHFDLRLEVSHALASWAVPKGPSLDHKAKRLAVQVEDHGLEHLDFEGRTEDHGRVQTKIVWDTGHYLPAEPPGPALDRGHLRFVVAGHKLKGAFALTQTKMGGNERNWLLVKVADEYADPDRDPTADENESVLTGVTNEELEGRRGVRKPRSSS